MLNYASHQSLISPPHEIARWLEILCVTLPLENFNIGPLAQFYNFFFQHNYTRVRKSTTVGNRLEDSLSQQKKKG